MARFLELTRGDGLLDTAVRGVILAALLAFCVALVGTTLSTRNTTRTGDGALFSEPVSSIQGAKLDVQ
ncbi:MAG: hypothetical protein P1V51_04165 [Deltaproteobacteria bacterium]|nr:hypothetical protein [Deltaproteobacteria bacterium]